MRILLLFITILSSFYSIGQDQASRDFSTSRTNMKFSGCHLFVLSEPLNEYDHVATINLPGGIFNVDISKEFEKIVKKARKKHPYFNGIVIYRDFKRANLIKFRDMDISSVGYRIGDKVVYKQGKELMIGIIREINAYRGKATFGYLNIYGEEKLIERKSTHLTPLSEEQYKIQLAAHIQEVERYKYDIGERATWKHQNKVMFGTVKALDDKIHKASIEYTDVFGDKKLKNIPYLDIITVDEEQYSKLSNEWNAEIAKYKFEVGEQVSWLKGEAFKNSKDLESGEVVNLNNKTHQADIKYTDDKGEEKIIKKNYLKLIKKK